MKLLSFLTLMIAGLFAQDLHAQDGGFHFGTKTGITLANQNWNGSERRSALTYHLNAFVESLDPEETGSLYAQLGLHNRGSNVFFTRITNLSNQRSYNFKNLSLQVGAKKLLQVDALGGKPYYFAGIRLEYTLFENMEEMQLFFADIYNNNPILTPNPSRLSDPIFVRNLNYGISFGGGIQFQGGEFFTPALELTISPDLSYQYDKPPFRMGDTSTRIRNVSLELSLVMRFLREIIYE